LLAWFLVERVSYRKLLIEEEEEEEEEEWDSGGIYLFIYSTPTCGSD